MMVISIKPLRSSPASIVQTHKFPSGEYLAKIHKSIQADEKIFITSSMSPPTNDSLMEIMSVIDAAENAGAGDITLICPYLGYARQHSVEIPYSSIGIKIVARMLEAAGVKHLVTVDIHSLEALDFFSIPVTHISVVEILGHYSSILKLDDFTIIAPDKGSKKRLEDLGCNIVTMDKIRSNASINIEINGDVEGKNCLIIDDILDSGNTMEAAIACLKANNAADIQGYCTHFLGKYTPSIPLYITDTVPLMIDKKNFSAILPISPFINKFL